MNMGMDGQRYIYVCVHVGEWKEMGEGMVEGDIGMVMAPAMSHRSLHVFPYLLQNMPHFSVEVRRYSI